MKKKLFFLSLFVGAFTTNLDAQKNSKAQHEKISTFAEFKAAMPPIYSLLWEMGLRIVLTFFTFFFFCIVSFVYVKKNLFETKGKILEDINTLKTNYK